MKFFKYSLLLVFLIGCSVVDETATEIALKLPAKLGECQTEFETYTVYNGETDADFWRVFYDNSGTGGTWEVQLLSGWRYDIDDPKKWVVLCGDVLAKQKNDLDIEKFPLEKAEDGVFLAARHINGVIQVSPVYILDYRLHTLDKFLSSGWPLFQVTEKDVITFSYRYVKRNGWIITTIQINGEEETFEHIVANEAGGYKFIREQNFAFYTGYSYQEKEEIGFSRDIAPNDIRVSKRRLCGPGSPGNKN